jgi:folate-dependent phosphoribosylglycinamide formyltransferase PurN
VNISDQDNIATLKKKVQFEEYRAYSSAIRKIFS